MTSRSQRLVAEVGYHVGSKCFVHKKYFLCNLDESNSHTSRFPVF